MLVEMVMLVGLGFWEVFCFCFGFDCLYLFLFFFNSSIICVDLMVSRSYFMYLGLFCLVF